MSESLLDSLLRSGQDLKELMTLLGPKPWPWRVVARPEQLAPSGNWRTFMYLAGRGAGKTRAGVEWILEEVNPASGVSRARGWHHRHAALIAPTSADARDVLVEGPSGIMACSPDREKPIYEPSKRRLTWWAGTPQEVIGTLFSAEEGDRLRGPQHSLCLADELAAWADMETWDMMLMGLRLGADPRVMVTTTPRNIPIIKKLVKDKNTAVQRGSSYDNMANLAPAFFEQIIANYEGTHLGRQEILGEIVDDVEGALWTHAMIDKTRVKEAPELRKIIIGVDPATTYGEKSDETGIIVCGIGEDKHVYVLADLSGKYPPERWARKVATAYATFGASKVIAEGNQGGLMVEATLKSVAPHLSVRIVHARTAKGTRAEPVAAMYETGRIHHVGCFSKLEDQMTSWEVGDKKNSPDRLDALAYAASFLLLGPTAPAYNTPGPIATRASWADRIR